MSKKTAVIVAGGTGGHLYPGIATAHAIVKQGGAANAWEPVFIVRQGDMGRGLLQREGFRVFEIPGQGFPRRLSAHALKFPLVLAAGFKAAWRILAELKPEVVVGMGGYLSFPVLIAARLKGIPTLIHEQNVYPGLSNRALSPFAKSIAVSFDASTKAFPASKVWVSGLPVRPDIGRLSRSEGRSRLHLDLNTFTVLIFGGSLGARHINQAVAATWPLLSNENKNLQVVHVTGERDHESMRQLYNNQPVLSLVLPYCHDMAAALAAADFVICRAGASSVAELVVAHKPALLIPYPFASENHQFYNADVLVQNGGADTILDRDVTPERLADRIAQLIRQPDRLDVMQQKLEALAARSGHREAAQRLAERITVLS